MNFKMTKLHLSENPVSPKQFFSRLIVALTVLTLTQLMHFLFFADDQYLALDLIFLLAIFSLSFLFLFQARSLHQHATWPLFNIKIFTILFIISLVVCPI